MENLNCMCVSISPILKMSKWCLVLPLVPYGPRDKHFANGCSFKISYLWMTLSVVFQIFYIPYVIVTSVIRVNYSEDVDDFSWYIKTIGYIVLEIDGAITLTACTIQAKSYGRILERLSILPASFQSLRKISKHLNIITIILILFYAILFSSFTVDAISRIGVMKISFKNYLDSAPGVFIRGLAGIFPQIQCVIVIMFALLIASKYDHLAQATELSLKRATHSSQNNVIRPVTVEWMKEKDMTGLTATHLEQLGDLYTGLCDCLADFNKCVGFQLLVALTANLYVSIYQLYRYITVQQTNSKGGQIRIHVHSTLSLANLILKLLLYVSMGQLVKNKYREPASTLQRAKILHLPSRLQQQIQTLLLQWSFTEKGYLSAFNVMNIGPWLIAPIVGNVVTYLLVAIQLDNASAPLPANLTAFLEGII